MNAHLPTRLWHRWRLFVISILALLLMGVEPAQAGNGRFKAGNYDFCVSVRFNASDAELALIRTAFQNASQVLATATDGQHRFRNITIVNDSGAGATAEYWVNAGAGRAYATQGKYGVRGEHVMLYFASNFQSSNGADGDSYTIAHEHAHHSYGVLDEYSGSAGNAECATPPDTATTNFCLMDNYFTRGGRSGGTTYTLNEFCVASNHDADADTFQQSVHGKSCWELIGSHPKRAATAPMGLPSTTAPGAQNVTFETGTGGLRVMLVIDRSGSMSGDRIAFARSAASLFTRFLRVGDSVGVASFSTSASVNFPLTTITGDGTRNAAISAINSLNASGSTNIGGGLQAGLGQLTGQSDHSCNEIIVLLTDGDHNVGTEPTAVIPALETAGVTVFSVAMGDGISTGGQAIQQAIASATGGRYLQVTSSFGLVGLFFELISESLGNGLLVRSPQAIGAGETREVIVPVESGASRATFAMALASSSDELTLTVRAPSGRVITQADAGVDPNVAFITDANLRALVIDNPQAGNWTVVVTAGAVSNGQFEVLADAVNEGVQVVVSLEKETLAFPEIVRIQATPKFGGENVLEARVTALVTRPDGSQTLIELFDNGQAQHGDAIPNDGVYSAQFGRYRGNGTYRFAVTASVVDGRTYGGEDLFAGEPSSSRQVPDFVRTASTSAVITGVPVVTPPAAPENLRVTGVSATTISLAWNDLSDNEDGFDIFRSTGGAFVLHASVGAGVTTFVDQNLPVNTTFRYQVRAANSGGDSAFSNEAEGTTQSSLPGAPTQLRAFASGSRSITLEWRPGEGEATGYRVERRSSGGSFQEIAEVGGSATGYTDNGVKPGTTYTYRVLATNEGGDSEYSNEASARIEADGYLLVLPWTIDCGDARMGQVTSRKLVLMNAGLKPLSVRVDGPAAPFRLTDPRQSFTLKPFEIRVMEVRFAPERRGQIKRRLTFVTGNRRQPRVNVDISGRGR